MPVHRQLETLQMYMVHKSKELALFAALCVLLLLLLGPTAHYDKVTKHRNETIIANDVNIVVHNLHIPKEETNHDNEKDNDINNDLNNDTPDDLNDDLEIADNSANDAAIDDITNETIFKEIEKAPFMKHSGLEEIDRFPLQRNAQRRQCTGDCLKVTELLNNWPAGKPKAAIYFLCKMRRVSSLVTALQSVYAHFNSRYNYPVVIFHEEDAVVETITVGSKNSVYFQQIQFEIPKFLTHEVKDNITCASKIGYRHMCRFHAKQVYQEPIIRGFEYLFRLDDDSEILKPIEYDVFRFMEKGNFLYGYRHLDSEIYRCWLGFGEATSYFINVTGIVPYFTGKLAERQIFYNNFEISKLSVWLRDEYQDYIQYLDRLGGIYYHRWGDAPIKTMAVSMLVPENRTHLFDDIRYKHGSFET